MRNEGTHGPDRGARTTAQGIREKIIFVSGKGGVGKTTVAAGLTLAMGRRGRRVAVIELGNDFIPTRLGHSPAGYAGAAIAPGVTAFNITPRRAFEEYASRELHSHRLYQTFLNNRFVHYFIDATPGVNALLSLGKIWWMATHESWDHCVVDLPATGHGLGYLEVPRVVTDAVHLGPLREVGERLTSMLTDAAFTRVCLVTHLEELPVTEASIMAARLSDPLGIACGPVIANAVWPIPIPKDLAPLYQTWRAGRSAGKDPVVAVTEFVRRRVALEDAQRERLMKELTSYLLEVPRFPEAEPASLLAAVAGRFEPWL
ncbi:MAG: P-loop NTPase [Deltaproteobacteria bacterium]|nr:P-loop NTPase [Deltaproteobacteria bacterium]